MTKSSTRDSIICSVLYSSSVRDFILFFFTSRFCLSFSLHELFSVTYLYSSLYIYLCTSFFTSLKCRSVARSTYTSIASDLTSSNSTCKEKSIHFFFHIYIDKILPSLFSIFFFQWTIWPRRKCILYSFVENRAALSGGYFLLAARQQQLPQPFHICRWGDGPSASALFPRLHRQPPADGY